MKHKKATATPSTPAAVSRPVATTNTHIVAPLASASAHARRDRIADRAYALWLAEGRPEGREMEHWLEAERQLDLSDTAASLENSETQTAATAREVGSDEFRERVEETLDEAVSPRRQRSATALD